MLEPILADKARREGLKAKRKLLFEEYLKSPLKHQTGPRN